MTTYLDDELMLSHYNYLQFQKKRDAGHIENLEELKYNMIATVPTYINMSQCMMKKNAESIEGEVMLQDIKDIKCLTTKDARPS